MEIPVKTYSVTDFITMLMQLATIRCVTTIHIYIHTNYVLQNACYEK